jgi:hypothetical protein
VIALEAIDEDQRQVRISADTALGQQWLQALTLAGEPDHAR